MTSVMLGLGVWFLLGVPVAWVFCLVAKEMDR